MNLKYTENAEFWASACTIAILILLGTYHVIFSMAAFGVSIVYLLRHNNNDALIMMFFLLSLAPIFKLDPAGSSLFTYLELGLLVFLYLRRKSISVTELLRLLLFAFYILGVQLLCDKVDFTNSIKMIVNIAMLFLISHMSSVNMKKLFLSYVAGVLCGSFFRLLDSQLFNISQYTKQNEIGFGGGIVITRFSGLYPDPNYYAITIIISLCLIVFLYTQNKLTLRTTVILTVPFFIFAGMTGSKSALIMLIIPISEMFLACWKNKNYGVLILFSVMLSLLVAGIIFGKIDLFNTTLDRFNIDSSNVDDLTTGRTALWRDYLSYFNENWHKVILGSSIATKTIETYLGEVAPHNTYIDLILQLGIIGSILFLSCIRIAYYNCYKKISRNFQSYTLVFVLIIMYCFLSQLQGYDLPFQIGITLFFLNATRQKQERKL